MTVSGEKPRLEELAAAETYLRQAYDRFSQVSGGTGPLPDSVDSPEYPLFVRYVTLAQWALNELNQMPDANAKLIESRRQGMLRPNKKQVLPIKTAILTGDADIHISGLVREVTDPSYGKTPRSGPKTINPYEIELAMKTLAAYNALAELDRGLCVRAGSLVANRLVERGTLEVVDGRTGVHTGEIYRPS